MIITHTKTRLRWKRVASLGVAALGLTFLAGYGLAALQAPDYEEVMARVRREAIDRQYQFARGLQVAQEEAAQARSEAERLGRRLDETRGALLSANAHQREAQTRLALAERRREAQSAAYRAVVARLRGSKQLRAIDVKAEDQKLGEVLDEIGAKAGREIVLDEAIDDRVSLELRGVDWTSAVRLLAKLTDCVYEETPTGARLSRPRKLTIQAADADLRSVVTMIASHGGKSVVIAPEVEGRVNLDLKEVRWDLALEAVLKTSGCQAIHDGLDLVRIVKK